MEKKVSGDGMTRKEAIEYMKLGETSCFSDDADKFVEAYHMAIDALNIEPLTDTEKRIFLSAMSREEKVCKSIDDEKVNDGTGIRLVPVCRSIERKVKKTLWR